MECDLELGGDGEPISGYECRITESIESKDCQECGRPISAGAEREIVTGNFEAEHVDWHTCMDCARIAEALQTEGRDHGLLWTQLEDCGGPDGDAGFAVFNSACLARVETASAKAYLQERYRKWLGIA